MNDLAKARRKGRIWALQFLFSFDVDQNESFSAQALQRYWDMVETSEAAKILAEFPESKEEAETRLRGIFENKTRIDELILAAAENWTISRMAVVDRNIMRVAVFEMLNCEDIPHKVSINEAVEISKTFADKDSSRFINGVLDRVKRNLESQA